MRRIKGYTKGNIKRIISLILVIAMLTSTLYACNDGEKKTADESNNSSANYAEKLMEVKPAQESIGERLVSAVTKSSNESADIAKAVNEYINALTVKDDMTASQLKDYISKTEISEEWKNTLLARNQAYTDAVTQSKAGLLDTLNNYETSVKANDSAAQAFNMSALDDYISQCSDSTLVNKADSNKTDSNKTDSNKADNEDMIVKTAPKAIPEINMDETDADDIQSKTGEKTEVFAANMSAYSNNELKATDGIMQLDEAAKAKVKELGTPLNIYNFLIDNIKNECYKGIKKGAQATYDSRAGSDADQATLFIAMLRYAGYDAGYIRGRIYLDAKEVMELTATDTVVGAARTLGALGNDVSIVISAGEPAGIQLEHTWVAAYVPYGDYRGSGSNSGTYRLLELDTSVKYLESEPEVKDEQYYLYGREIKKSSCSYLPMSLRFDVIERSELEAVYGGSYDSISINISGNVVTLNTWEMYCKQYTIMYEPETQEDRQLIDSFGGIMNVPSYLVHVVPVLKSGNEVILSGNAVNPGDKQKVYFEINNGGENAAYSNIISAGSMYSVVMDYGFTTSEHLEAAKERYEAASAKLNAMSKETYESRPYDILYSEDILGSLLNLGGVLYYVQKDVNDIQLANYYEINGFKGTSVLMTGYEFGYERSFGFVTKLSEGYVFIDADYDLKSAVARADDEESKQRERLYMFGSGLLASQAESEVWETLLSVEAVSTSSLITDAFEAGEEVVALSAENYYDDYEYYLDISDDTRSAIESKIDDGYVVIMPFETSVVGSWQGEAYMIIDPLNGSGAYMISGGLKGGSTGITVPEAALFNCIIDIVDLIATMKLFLIGLSACVTATTYLVGFAGLALAAFSMIAYINTAEQLSKLFMNAVDYACGDESAGDEIISDAVDNAIMLAIGGGVCALLGIAAKLIMKNKLMAKLGKTVAEEFMKRYGDDIRACKKMYYELMDELKNKKTQTAVAKSANPENTSFYVNQMDNGTSDATLCEIAENNAKGLKYPDELLHEMSDTKMADEMVTVVNKHGETATQLMEAYKDDAVKVLTEYGDDTFAIIKTYGDDVIPYLSQYGDDALEALEKGITKDQIDKLARQGIKPGEYAEKGIIDEATAKVVIEGELNSNYEITWNKAISATQEVIEGTNIPKSFIIKGLNVNGKEVWVHGNATKHMGEYVNSAKGSIIVENELMLSFQETVSQILPEVKSGRNFFNINGWEIGINGDTGVIYHALYK